MSASASDLSLMQAEPALWSPLALAAADMRLQGKRFQVVPHLELFNRVMLDVAYAKEGQRIAINVQQQVAKSTLWSMYFPAWRLLHWPEKQIVILAHEDDFAAGFGLYIRDVIERWGGALGIKVRKDTRAKGSWQVEGTGGGVTCRGRGASVAGLPVDDLIIDDLLRDGVDAMSDALLEANWTLVSSVVRGRLRAHTNLIMVGTRWTRRDHFGRMFEQARVTGERWTVIRLPALAEEGDPLGRQPGEPLWPEQIAMKDLRISQQTAGPWWAAAWMQRPEDETGQHFTPWGWPRYGDLTKEYGQRAWAVPVPGGNRTVVFPRDVTVLVTVDWAASERRGSDYTAFLAGAVLPDQRILLLDVRRERWSLEALVGHLAEFCRLHRPDLVACEADAFQGALANEARRHPEIGEIRRLKTEGKGKLQRALGAIVMGQQGRVLLPEGASWLDGFCTELTHFTGSGAGHDDRVDALAYACKLLRELTPVQGSTGEPIVLTEGKTPFW